MNQEQQPAVSQYDPEIINRLKKEIINDLKARREWQEKYYGQMTEYNENYAGYPPGFGPGTGYGRRAGARMGYGRRGPGYGPGMGIGPGKYSGWCPYPPQASMYRNWKSP